MERPTKEISYLADQCNPDRSFEPMIPKAHGIVILKYIEWLEDRISMEDYIESNIKSSSDLE